MISIKLRLGLSIMSLSFSNHKRPSAILWESHKDIKLIMESNRPLRLINIISSSAENNQL